MLHDVADAGDLLVRVAELVGALILERLRRLGDVRLDHLAPVEVGGEAGQLVGAALGLGAGALADGVQVGLGPAEGVRGLDDGVADDLQVGRGGHAGYGGGLRHVYGSRAVKLPYLISPLMNVRRSESLPATRRHSWPLRDDPRDRPNTTGVRLHPSDGRPQDVVQGERCA